MKEHPKPLPPLRSDVDAEHFVDTADLSEYDLSEFKPMRFEIEPQAASLNMRLRGLSSSGTENLHKN
jgi:predicted DNA binding CopG/RHH family protein